LEGCSLQGVLAQAKNGDKVFWEEKLHAANGKAQACTQGALIFFLLGLFWGGWGEVFFIFPWFSMCSHYVPFKFAMSSHYVPSVFPNFPACSP
jgi:hypothetical protein